MTEREWWEGDKHIAVKAMAEVLHLTGLALYGTWNHTFKHSGLI